MSSVASENFKQGREEQLARLNTLFIDGKNPLYLWEAIYLCLCPPEGYPSRDLPAWCMPYLAMVASQLLMLSHFKDPKSYPENQPGEQPEEYRRRREDWAAQPAISPERASELVPWVLRLDRRGWNAFRRYFADQQAVKEAILFPVLARQDKRAAIDRVKARFNVSEDRSVRRLIRQGADLLMGRTKRNP